MANTHETSDKQKPKALIIQDVSNNEERVAVCFTCDRELIKYDGTLSCMNCNTYW